MRRVIALLSFTLILGGGLWLVNNQSLVTAQPSSCQQDSDCPSYAPLCQSGRCVERPAGPVTRPFAKANFAVNTQAIGACLISVNPNWGYVGSSTALTGRLFGSPGAVEFTDYNNGYTAAPHGAGWSWNATNITGALVPNEAYTGTVRVHPSSRNPSNELVFTVRGPGGTGQGPEQCISNVVCTTDNDCPVPFTNGCAVLRNPSCCQVRPQVQSVGPVHNSSDVCVNAAVEITFNVNLDPARAINNQIVLFQKQNGGNWQDVTASRSVAGNKIVVTRQNCALLDNNATYRVVLKGGESGENLRSRLGVSMRCDPSWATGNRGECDGVDYVLRFSTDPNGTLCAVGQLNVLPNQQSVGITETVNFTAVGRSSSGQALCLNQVNWSLPSPVLSGVSGAPGAAPHIFNVTAGTVTGQTQVRASTPIPDSPGYVANEATLIVTAGAPRVLDDSSCSAGQSPAPRPNRADACSNSLVQVRFTMPMDQTTLALQVKDCGADAAFSQVNCLTNLTGTVNTSQSQISFNPNANLITNHWYQAIVPGSVLGAVDSGHLPLTNLNYDSDSNGTTDAYEWHWHVRDNANECRVEAIGVVPSQRTFTIQNEQDSFNANATNREFCAVVEPNGNWSWDLKSSSPAGVITFVPASGPSTMVTAVNEGVAQLRARLSSFNGEALANINVDFPNPLQLGSVRGGECRNSSIIVEFTQVLNVSTVNGANIKLQYCDKANLTDCQITDWVDVNITLNRTVNNFYHTVVTLIPSQLLNPNGFYRLMVKGGTDGVRDIYNQFLQDAGGALVSEEVRNLPYPPREICSINRVVISRHALPITQDTFLCAGANNCVGDDDPVLANNQHIFTAQALAANGEPVTADYHWSLASGGNELITLTPVGAQVTAVPANKNGNTNLIVEADNADPQYGRARGSVNLRLFLCQNPWPAVYSNPSDPSDPNNGFWEPFIDNDTGFSFYYCRDDGSAATTTDDLPPLPPPIRRVHSSGDLFRELIFLPGSTGGEVQSGNNPPFIDPINNLIVDEYQYVQLMIYGHDPERDSIIIESLDPLPNRVNFTDLGDGSAVFSWLPDGTQGGSTLGQGIDYHFRFQAVDSAGTAGSVMEFTITVMDNSPIEPIPAAPQNVHVVISPFNEDYDQAALTWNTSVGAQTYRVFRRDDGAIQGGGSGSGAGYEQPNSLQPSLRWVWQVIPQTLGQWLKALLLPLNRLLEAPLAYATGGSYEPSGSYIEQGTVANSSCTSGQCSFMDSQVPILHHLCYAVKACNNTGCSVYSAPACANSPGPNYLPVVNFIQPPSSPLRLRPGDSYTFRAQITESDVDDYIKRYEWQAPGSVPYVSDGNYGSNRVVDFTKTFENEGSFTVAIRAKDSHDVWSAWVPVTVEVQTNAGPNACIIDPGSSSPPPAWCNL